MLQTLPQRNDSIDRLVRELVDDLDAIERGADAHSDAASWAKAKLYIDRFHELAGEDEFQGKRGNALSRAINRRLDADGVQRDKQLPRLSFRSHALQLGRLWPEVFAFERKYLTYQDYSRIAVCSLPREQKDAIRAETERAKPKQEQLRQIIRAAVDAHNGIYKPDFELKPSNFWKFTSPHDNNGYGGIHPEVVANLLYWFTEPGDVVLDPMAGSGVLADTLVKYRFFRESYEAEGSGPRIALMSDIAPPLERSDIVQADATAALPFEKASARLAILDPPYLRIADGKQYENIGDTLDEWLKSIRSIITNVIPCLAEGGALAVLTDDVLRKNEHVPIAYRITGIIEELGLTQCATIYNHTPNFVFSMGPAQMRAARKARLHVNGCKIIQVARRPQASSKRK